MPEVLVATVLYYRPSSHGRTKRNYFNFGRLNLYVQHEIELFNAG